MTYLVLARKWRPRSFDTLVGQEHVVRALTHALSTQRLHHAWLFTGTRGVGKTTLSRLLAKSLNCEQGITPTPCGHCHACTEIDEGRFVDYVELDAASNRGVDEMTQLLEQAVYAPGAGRFKVYMIDEVHMLTGHAFNAMLKTLEEPPPHVKFILATTDPQKIPVTVLSRCLQFNLKQMTAQAIVGHLQIILEEEKMGFEVPALRLIAQAASGSMRDALSLTDQAIAYSAGQLTAEAVRGMLGTIDQRYLVRLLEGLAAGDGVMVVQVADELAARGLSYSGALADLSVFLSRVAIEQRVSGVTPTEDPSREDIVMMAQKLTPDVVQLFYTVAVHSRSELVLSPDEYAGFVMACLRMLALLPEGASLPLPTPPTSPDPGKSVQAESSSAAEGSEPASAASVASSSDAAGSVGDVSNDNDVPPWHVEHEETQDSSSSFEVPSAAFEIPAEMNDELPEPIDESFLLPVSDHDEQPAFAEPAAGPKPLLPELQEVSAQNWPALAASLPVTGVASELARQSEWLGVQGNEIGLRVAVRTLAETLGKARLCTLLSEHFGQVVTLRVEFGHTGSDTAHAVQEAERAECQKQAETAVQHDPFVQNLLQTFDAKVLPGSISPAGKAA